MARLERARALLLPGLTYLGVLIGGGYATGRELVEFFIRYGPWAAVLGILVTMVLMSVVLAYTFEFARLTRSYDYNSLFKHLLGRGRVAFEVCFLALNTVVLAVMGAAAGSMVAQRFGVPLWVGACVFSLLVVIFVFLGGRTVERLFLYWSPLLIALYVIFFGVSLLRFNDTIAGNFISAPELHSGWLIGAIAYTGYNVVIGPSVLFSLVHTRTRRDALLSGVLAGPIGMLPALFFVIALIAVYPTILNDSVPSQRLLSALQMPLLGTFFLIVVFGTLVQTAVGVLKAICDRIDQGMRDRSGRPMTPVTRGAVALALLVASIGVAQAVGLVNLIAKGYGVLAWAFVALYLVPILTVGVWAVHRRYRGPESTAAGASPGAPP